MRAACCILWVTMMMVYCSFRPMASSSTEGDKTLAEKVGPLDGEIDQMERDIESLCKIAVNGVIVSNHGSGPLYILLDV